MSQLILNIKDKSKLTFLMTLIKQLDFVEIEQLVIKDKKIKHDFFNSAGIWKDKDISSKKLRQQAWER